MPGCCVPNCDSKYVTVPYHRFPNPEKRLEAYNYWLDALGLESLKIMDPAKVYVGKRICSNHFEEKYKRPGSRLLHKQAVPTLNLHSNLNFVLMDHSYIESGPVHESTRYIEDSDDENNKENTITPSKINNTPPTATNQTEENSNKLPTTNIGILRQTFNTTCSIPHCLNFRRELIHVHSFPSNPMLCRKWVDALGLRKPVKEYMKICSDHFKENDFVPGSFYKELKKNAIPSLKNCGPNEFLRECFAKNCSNNSVNNKNLAFFPFPVARNKATLWISLSNPKKLNPFTNFKKRRYLCAKHFKNDDFKLGSRKTVLKSYTKIIPTIFNENVEISKENNTKEGKIIKNTVNTAFDKFDSSLDNLNKKELQNNSRTLPIILEESTMNSYNCDTVSLESNQIEHFDFTLDVEKDYCRLCAKLVTVNSLTPIFENEIFTVNGKKLDELMPKKITKEDNLPKMMCSECVLKLDTCHKTLQEFLNAESQLKDIIKKENVYKAQLNSELKKMQRSWTEKIKITIVEDVKSNNENQQIELRNCSICEQIFFTKQELEDHFLKVHPKKIDENKIACTLKPDIPNKSETNMSKISQLKGYSRILYECKICKSLYLKKHFLIEHALSFHSEVNENRIVCGILKLNHKSEIIKCAQCNNVFINSFKYKNHMRKHDEMTCGKCGYVAKTILEIQKHIRDHEEELKNTLKNNDEILNDSMPQVVNMTEYTKILDEIKRNDFELKQRENMRKRSLCHICGKFFLNTVFLNYHLLRHSEKRSYKCNLCSQAFKTILCLRRHKKIHITEQNYICHFCGKQFRHQGTLNAHFKTHATSKSHHCEVCGLGFHNKTSLMKHMNTHNVMENKLYQCKYCDKEFQYKSIYLVHVRAHTEKKRSYPCDMCDKIYPTKHQLELHHRIHTGETSISCEICGRSFKALATMRKHKLIHTDILPHECLECSRKFRWKHSLIIHRRTHTGERPYKCSNCGKGFISHGGLNNHKQIHTRPDKYKSSMKFEEVIAAVNCISDGNNIKENNILKDKISNSKSTVNDSNSILKSLLLG